MTTPTRKLRKTTRHGLAILIMPLDANLDDCRAAHSNFREVDHCDAAAEWNRLAFQSEHEHVAAMRAATGDVPTPEFLRLAWHNKRLQTEIALGRWCKESG